MSESWLPGILHCYDVPGLPRSNLDLESIFGTLRRAQRRTSGRKETTPIRIFGPGQIALLSLEDAEILPLLRFCQFSPGMGPPVFIYMGPLLGMTLERFQAENQLTIEPR
jgi:hypothetical protein